MAVVVAVVLAGSACGDRSTPAGADASPPSAAATPPGDFGPWRYAKELAAAASGLEVVPVLELSAADRGRAQVVAAVQRPGTPLPTATIEIWTFEQRGEDLAPVGDPVVVVATASDITIDATAQEALRRARATPGTVLLRPVGLAVERPADLVTRLSELAHTARDPAASAAARAEALATLVRGVDDDVLFGPRFGALVDLLAGEPLDVQPTDAASERRVRLVTTATPPHTFDVWKEGDGWVLAAYP